MSSLKLPRIIGHRGACGYAPENTIESIHTAADMGIDWVEIDVKLTNDDIPIIFHDDTLDRTTNGSGLVAETTYEDIRNLEAGSWFSDSFAGVKIPTLEEMIDVLIERNLGLNLEIKPCPGREKETAEIALDMLSRVWDDHNRLIISSFSHVSMEIARDMATDWHRGLLISENEDGGEFLPENWKDMADYLDVSTVHIPDALAIESNIEQISDYDKPVLVFTINDGTRARELQMMGIQAVFTDVPDVVQDGMLTIH
jgi:glycerophosphoryl diester phosphodiesterase